MKIGIILKHSKTGRYHPAIFVKEKIKRSKSSLLEPGIVRLSSESHHTIGFDNLDDAIKEMSIHSQQLSIYSQNICNEPIEWDGEMGIQLVLRDWRAYKSIRDSLHPPRG